MRNLKPVHILFGGSSIVAFLCFIILLISNNYRSSDPWIFLIPIILGFCTYWVFYFFIKRFITQKLKILYRSIRKGKFDENLKENFKITDNVIEMAEIDSKKWHEERTMEISQLKEKDEFRREFLGNLAHELKTPVFSVQGYILTLLEGGLEDEKVNRMFLERASKATQRMTDILTDLDQISGIEVNKIELELSDFDINILVKEIYESLELNAKEKNISLKFAKHFEPVMVRADRRKIGQVLTNLIGNAIVYGNKDGLVEVRFYLMNNIVTIEVSDDGPGISDEELPRLFERFYRVEKSRNRHEGGSGLGLSIAKLIVEAHGQTINVRSTIGAGSTFTLGLDQGKE